MGTCRNCGSLIQIGKGEDIICPVCNHNPFVCRECHTIFKEESISPICNICGWYICDQCNSCSPECNRNEYKGIIVKILNENKQLSNSELSEIIIQKIYAKIRGLDRLNCPKRNVPISYAKSLNRSMALKIQGYKIQDDNDKEMFIERYNKIEDKNIGDTWRIEEIRTKGSMGQEDRTTSNLAVCMGLASVEHIKFKKCPICEQKYIIDDEYCSNDNCKTKKNKKVKLWVVEYDQFVRQENNPCEYARFKDLIKIYCPICNKTFNINDKYCDTCQTKKKKSVKLVALKSYKHFCQLERQRFVELKKGEKKENGCDKI